MTRDRITVKNGIMACVEWEWQENYMILVHH